jgi:hypothetical protein
METITSAEERAYRRLAEKAKSMAMKQKNPDIRDQFYAAFIEYERLADKFAITEGKSL